MNFITIFAISIGLFLVLTIINHYLAKNKTHNELQKINEKRTIIYGFLMYGSMAIAALSMYLVGYFDLFHHPEKRFYSVVGFFIASIGFYYCFKWECADEGKYKHMFFDYETLIGIIGCLAFSLITLFSPLLKK